MRQLKAGGQLHLRLDVRGQESAEIGDRIIGDGHLAKMVLPDVGLDRSAGERLPSHLDDFAFAVDARICDGGNAEADERARSPEAPREIVREQKAVESAFLGKEGNRLLRAGPCRSNAGLKPAAEFEAVKLRLIHQEFEQFEATHFAVPFANLFFASGNLIVRFAGPQLRKDALSAYNAKLKSSPFVALEFEEKRWCRATDVQELM